MTGSGLPGHLAPLGTTGWAVWRDVAVRGAGLPAARARAVHGAPAGVIGTDLARTAADPRFREAVAWQNPDLLGRCLDRVRADTPRNRQGRRDEATVAAYLQRFALKNDTIGAFGPVGWATVTTEAAAPWFAAVPGPALLSRRTTYFETWAIDEAARAFLELPGLRAQLPPRPAGTIEVVAGVLHRLRRRPVELSPDQLTVLDLCDGVRPLHEVLDKARSQSVPDSVFTSLLELGAVELDLSGPVEARPEETLRTRLEALGDRAVAEPALTALAGLVAARDAVARAADAEAVAETMAVLGEVFLRVTGTAATRRPGEAYAGRTLVYQDCVRDVDVRIGPGLLAAVAAPLGLMLDSAAWLVATVGAAYREFFGRLYQRERERWPEGRVPLGYLVNRAAPDLDAAGSAPPLVKAAVAEFQKRWAAILAAPDGVRTVRFDAADIAPAVAAAFGGPAARAPWSAARQHSPDLLFAAADAAALADGDFTCVLGELHLAVNSLESRSYVEQHPDPARLLAASEADHGDRRILCAPPKTSRLVTSRVMPPSALLSDRFTYWSWSPDPESMAAPGRRLPGAGITVREAGGELVVEAGGAEHDLLEMLGEILSGVVVNAFQPFPAAGHRPRVTVDRVVVARECWVFTASALRWAFLKDERERFEQAGLWRAANDIPELVFFRTPLEGKPIAVDFRSAALVGIWAKAVRAAAADTTTENSARITVTEMLPGPDDLWLTDADGARYTSEFRFVATRPAGALHD
ncbi:hypothetical protein ABH926_007774 [Catenulispora sp. GP43]|uniref:lantibiotic dehydratase n=1 Tax=Catenulispora sp. GP43 TaxID=3156263 RepID=UPI003510FB05